MNTELMFSSKSEKRLIDANAMRADWLENGENEYVYDTNAVLDSIDSQPTVDAVEVVRCWECDHKTHDGSGRPYCWQLKMYLNKELDFFCKYGKRKEGAD